MSVSLEKLSVGVVGGGIAGAAAALMLGRLGAQVTLYEQVAEPHAVGAGILLQPMGLAVLRALDVSMEAELQGSNIIQLLGHNPRGQVVLDSRYEDWRADSYGVGIHRGALYDALWRRLRMLSNVTVRTGMDVVQVKHSGAQALLSAADGESAAHDLLIDAEGVHSKLRAQLDIAHMAKPYPWGAFWAILPMTADWPRDVLLQRYLAARQMAGVLPMGTFGGQEMASLFWSVPAERLSNKPTLSAFKDEVLQLWPELADFLDGLTSDGQIASARYADVVMPHWHDQRVVLIGDAAHAMSPQLGQGATMGLLDAYVLTQVLRQAADVPEALAQYSAARKHHLRYYQWASRWLTPLFQSDRTVAPWLRDRFMNTGNIVPAVRRVGARTLVGAKQGWFRRDFDVDGIVPF